MQISKLSSFFHTLSQLRLPLFSFSLFVLLDRKDDHVVAALTFSAKILSPTRPSTNIVNASMYLPSIFPIRVCLYDIRIHIVYNVVSMTFARESRPRSSISFVIACVKEIAPIDISTSRCSLRTRKRCTFISESQSKKESCMIKGTQKATRRNSFHLIRAVS